MNDDRTLELEASDETPCAHCGCAFNRHRGGTPQEDPAIRRKCPPLWRGLRGIPDTYPRTTADEGPPFDAYWQRVEAYWAAPTVFTPAS